MTTPARLLGSAWWHHRPRPRHRRAGGARCTRLLADYGATVVKVGAVPGRGTDPIRPPYYAYSGRATCSARRST